jgi:site-specific DNA-methyltransferase (adenine-specific)
MKLYKGDCLIESDKIKNGSVDLILTDLPYGTVKDIKKVNHGMSGKCEWDVVIDTDKIMEVANRILRKNGKMVLFAQQPFTNELINKAIPNVPFCYSMIWEKDHFANALTAKKAPLNYYEDILIFSKTEDTEKAHPLREYFYTEYEKTGLTYKEINRDYLETTFEGGGGMAYNMLCRTRLYFSMPTKDAYSRLQKTGYFNKPYEELKVEDEAFKNKMKSTFNLWEGKKYKSNILKYKKDYDGHHPTQKPVLLLEDLIKTFSNENDLVVDLTMGSGSTGVACKNTNRDFIGIEMNEEYFKIAEQRINDTKYTLF